MRSLPLYVHIPFCSSICAYCDFAKVIYKEEWVEQYLEALKQELLSFLPLSCPSIYIGGGTPSSLNETQLRKLLSFLSPLLEEGGEFDFEANPDSLTSEKIALLHEFGVNRLSIGVQSSSPRLLSLMGRKHNFSDVEKCVKEAKENGISEISCDLIYSLPGETLEEVNKDIEALLSLDIPHISTYSLTVSPGTRFFYQGIKESGDDISADQYELILKRLREANYVRYEVSNFAKNGHEGKHNLFYWHDLAYLGIGLGASGYLDGSHYSNTRSLAKYLKGERIEAKEARIGKKDAIEYFLLTNLRLAEGFLETTFSSRFQLTFKEFAGKKLEKLVNNGLLKCENGSIFPTDLGISLLDRVLLELY